MEILHTSLSYVYSLVHTRTILSHMRINRNGISLKSFSYAYRLTHTRMASFHTRLIRVPAEGWYCDGKGCVSYVYGPWERPSYAYGLASYVYHTQMDSAFQKPAI